MLHNSVPISFLKMVLSAFPTSSIVKLHVAQSEKKKSELYLYRNFNAKKYDVKQKEKLTDDNDTSFGSRATICFGGQRWVNNLFTYCISGESDCETSRRTLILKHVVHDEILGYTTLIVMSQIDERSENSRLRSANAADPFLFERGRKREGGRERERRRKTSTFLQDSFAVALNRNWVSRSIR